MKFIAFTAVPNFLPFFQAVLSCVGISSVAGNFQFIIGSERADLAAESALSLPGIFTWPEIQHSISR